MHGDYGTTRCQRASLPAGHAVALGVVAWLYWFGGFERLALVPGDPLRRSLLFSCGLIYLLRFAATVVLLGHRSMEWSEVVVVLPWLWVIHLTFAFTGGTSMAPVGWPGMVALVLYGLGSYLNTASEYQRMRWKQRPENQGRLYTGGLFRYSMHINYFGDTLLFTGFALLTRSPWALLIPVIMTAGFLFQHIPQLDRYLSQRYGAQFAAYAGKTRKFVPFVY